MVWSKSCPRCHGDLIEQRDEDGLTVACLQCGRSLPAEQARALKAAGRDVVRIRAVLAATPTPARAAGAA